MSFFASLVKKELIGGLEISETAVRFALVSFDNASEKFVVRHLGEAPLEKGTARESEKFTIRHLGDNPTAKGTAREGTGPEKKPLTETLRKIVKSFPFRIPYAVLTVPADGVYCQSLSFPPSLDGKRVEEALRLAVDIKFPWKKEDVYSDWEKTEIGEKTAFLACAIKKSIADGYIAACEDAGIKIIAIEFHPISILRSAVEDNKKAVMMTIEYPSSTTACVVKNKQLRFMRVIPYERAAKKNIETEFEKLRNFYETEYEKIEKIIPIQKLALRNEFNVKKISRKNIHKWYGALGAGARAALPRGNDSAVSLMALGTDEAFRYEKMLSFGRVLSSTTVAIALFLTASFALSWIFLASMGKNYTRSKAAETSYLPPEFAKTKEEIREFSKLLQITNEYVKETPEWSGVLQELRESITNAIAISSFTISSPDGSGLISGIAKSRAELNQLKRRLENIESLSEVTLPLSNLELKENIPFSVSFRFNKQSIYKY